MPGGWSKLRDVRKLAETRAEFEFDIPVAELPGIPSDVAAAGGSLHALLRFGREQGFAIADIALRGAVQALCQRCTQAVAVSMDTDSRLAVVESEPDADAVPAGWDTYLALEGRLDLAALVAEEVLLALPIVALHEHAACRPPAAATAEEPQAEPVEERTRPFADLRALLERGAKPK
jgi:uncharacterized protein